jgi:EmrB/QacA subfamily drug resistance transporter
LRQVFLTLLFAVGHGAFFCAMACGRKVRAPDGFLGEIMADNSEQFSFFRRWIVFVTSATGIFMAMLCATSVNVALPILEKEFSASLSGIQWVVTSYLLTISSVLPVFGWAGDMIQRRRVIAVGFFLFGLGGFLCSQATSLSQLIFSRVVQGIGAGMESANSYAALTAVFPVNQRGKVFGMQGSIVALGSISGPSIGGFLLEYFSWHSIFYVTLPFAVLGVALSLAYMPKAPPRKADSFDFVGAIVLIGAIATFILALSQWGRIGWTDAEIAFFGLLSLALFALLLYWERRTKSPLIDIGMFRNKIFLSGNMAGLCSFLALNANSMLMPFYLHKILDATPKTMGMVMITFPVALIVVAPLSGALSDRYGAPRFSVTGMSLMMLALLLLAFVSRYETLWPIVCALALFGAGNGMFQSPNNSTTLAVIPPEKHGMAGSIIALMRNFGAVVGIALSVRICDLVSEIYMAGRTATPELEKAAFMQGYQVALVLGAAFAALGIFCSLAKRKNIAESKNV